MAARNGPAGVEEQGTFTLRSSRNLGGPVASVDEPVLGSSVNNPRPVDAASGVCGNEAQGVTAVPRSKGNEATRAGWQEVGVLRTTEEAGEPTREPPWREATVLEVKSSGVQGPRCPQGLATVHRIWQKYGLQPHRVSTFKFSRDPEFDRKLADIVGLYLDPPERALVLCVDEKSQIQALNRTQPALPMWPGLPARMTHDYTRHGTTSLFAVLEVASGKVHGRCFPRHTHAEFIDFLKLLARRYPKRELHLICDNYGTHKHPAVKQWLAVHPRVQLHFTPSSASWLNLVERWFAIITGQAIRRGSFDSVRRLEAAIMNWLSHWNDNAKPFRWTKSAAAVKRSIRNAALIYETQH